MDEIRPTSFADVCLDRIATALEILAMSQQAADQARVVPAETPLPDDLPGRAALAAVGITGMEKLPRKAGELERLGLDGGTISRLLTWLKVNG